MKVLITGSEGRIGKILKAQLEHEITEYDLPKFDAGNFEQLVQTLKDQDTVIHLAWNTKTDNYLTDSLDLTNMQLASNVYRAAIKSGVRRVIVASSVHASMPPKAHEEFLIAPSSLPYPDSPYGAEKVFIEALGRYYADYAGLEVICLRFGGVGWGEPAMTDPEHRFWLSNEDCLRLLESCITAESIHNNYMIINAISDNSDRVHDPINSLGWHPKDGIR